MYSILKELNNKKNNIISIENPVKMKIPGINQVQIQEDKGITYNSILRNISLIDPNVIAIDELINDEITRKAVRLAANGNLVISKMPDKTIYQTIDSLLKMDVENYLLGANLNEIICQRLVKKLCPACRKKEKATEYEKKIIKEITGKDVTEIYYPVGCEECNDGYKDQIPVAEVIILDDELRNCISNNKNRQLIRKTIYSEIDSILKDGFTKVINSDTSFSEIIRILDPKIDLDEDQEDLKQFIFANNSNNTTEEENEENNNPVKETTEEDEKEPEEPKEEKKEEPPKNTANAARNILKTSLLGKSSEEDESSTESTYNVESSKYEEQDDDTEEDNYQEDKEEEKVETKKEENIDESDNEEKQDDETTEEDEKTDKDENQNRATTIREISRKKSFFFDDDDDDEDEDDYNYDSSYTIV